MFLRKIKLANFRNYPEQEINLNNRFNFIHGNNGEGKTNILEAVSFISYGKSFLNSADTDCVRFGNEEFYIEGLFDNDAGSTYNLSVNYTKLQKRKTILLNKDKVTRYSSDMFGRFPAVFLSPHSLNITYGNPSERRKFFDIIIAQTSRVYLDMLKDLVRVLKQKNALLKNYMNIGSYDRSEFTKLLESYNNKLAEISSDVVFRRFQFLREFKGYFRNNYSNLIGENVSPSINYYSCVHDKNLSPDTFMSFTRDEILDSIRTRLSENTKEEIARNISLYGPHRDDFIFEMDKQVSDDGSRRSISLKNYASQGEHKTFVIGLILAQYHYLRDKLGNSPMLLLDDVLSELDPVRVSKIISHLKEYGQIFLTATDLVYNSELKKFYGENEISYFNISGGKVAYEKN